MYQRLRTFSWFPDPKQLDKEIVAESRVQHLRYKEDIGAALLQQMIEYAEAAYQLT